ncbi:hypothetical protein KIJ05_07855 [Leuconostoc gelidum subsp. gasicomitatum]|uniref:hypothetical protein n=1 Tax=Leuconostoc gasicomitatum TaxID=115778 RepID=UPI001CC6500D|nr:hypothetical protein [Leuconostoc gasicomitatum]MBZ5985031.1 hypothetical protein [Leuconostoc gasicomitatum]
MYFEQHNSQVDEMQAEIDAKSVTLANKIRNLIETNGPQIEELHHQQHFIFFDEDNNPMEIKSAFYLKMFTIGPTFFYYSIFEKQVINLEYNNDVDFGFPIDVTDHLEEIIASKPSVYITMEHVFGLTGILGKDFQSRKQLLQEIQSLE